MTQCIVYYHREKTHALVVSGIMGGIEARKFAAPFGPTFVLILGLYTEREGVGGKRRPSRSKSGSCNQLIAKFDGLGRIKPGYRGYFNAKLNF
jgi:hypothetical protein